MSQQGCTQLFKENRRLRTRIAELETFVGTLGESAPNASKSLSCRMQSCATDGAATRERFARIVSTVSVILCSFLLRPNGTACFPFANPALEAIHDLRPVELELDATPILIRVHPDDVFANLVGNALDYFDPHLSGNIDIGCLNNLATMDSQVQTYFVKENGQGISDKGRAIVFQPFQRMHTHMAPGEGIGLVIVKRAVERHGGKIWFESVAGEGTTFFVALPAPQQEDATNAG